ncbi:MAG: cyclic nucleotide-binding domain-containing protein [Tepidamorphaceae bacterium]|nr:cyclic nucleotide-binding domain-containing protein [Rhodobiaceae bacterium]MCC0049858.1 cyclic nucleotide-binding domain-containing protein [Rhodobiaceae bacterium]
MDLTADNLFSVGKLVGHLSYVLLVLSMMMRSMTWLRVIAVSAGLTSGAYGYFWLNDPVTVFWEAVFVLTNLVQLLILAFENRKRALSEEEQIVIRAMLPNADMRAVRRILKLGVLREVPPETVLIEQGGMVPDLIVLTRGTVQVEKDGKIIGACGEGDFLGEMSFLSGEPATATVMVTNPTHYMAFERTRFRVFLDRNPDIRHIVEASFNRNLMAKLVRTSHAVGGEKPESVNPIADSEKIP